MGVPPNVQLLNELLSAFFHLLAPLLQYGLLCWIKWDMMRMALVGVIACIVFIV